VQYRPGGRNSELLKPRLVSVKGHDGAALSGRSAEAAPG
jgi:hypothetical protein